MIDYAHRHRYRVRNLHDGLPVPPIRPKRVPGHRPAYVAAAHRFDAIVCRHGYVSTDGQDIGWALLCRSRRAMTPKLRNLVAIPGVVVVQEGDAEAAGSAPAEALVALLAVLRPYRRAHRAELAGRKPPTAADYPRCAPGLGAPQRRRQVPETKGTAATG